MTAEARANQDPLIEAFELLCSDPQEFSQRHDGQEPQLPQSLVGFNLQGWVVNGNVSPEIWSKMRGRIIPLRPAGGESTDALKAKLSLRGAEDEYGKPLLYVMVRAKDGYPFRWTNGFINPDDLDKDLPVLISEAIEAERNDDTPLASSKMRAVFAKTPPSQHPQIPDWDEIFIEPHSS